MPSIDDAIEALKKASIAEPQIVPPPSTAQIREAENALGCGFPPSFVAFLAKGGAFALPYWETYWVGDETLGHRNIVKATLAERTEAEPALPAFLVAFHNNGCGDQLCFDTRSPDSHGEYPIVFWDHEISAEENLADLARMADNFADWLMEEVQSRLRQE
jgi:hypothetical protein